MSIAAPLPPTPEHHPDEFAKLRWFHWVIILLSLLLTLLAWHISKTQSEEKIRLQFEREAERSTDLILERLKNFEDALRGGVAAIHSQSMGIDYYEWKRFAHTLQIDNKYPGFQGIGVVSYVPRAQLKSFLLQQRKLRPDYAISPNRPQAHEYWPVTFIEPVETNSLSSGMDISQEKRRFKAAQQARDSGESRITGRITLRQDTGRNAAIWLLTPYYHGGTYEDIPLRREHFQGLVYAPIILHKLMTGTLESHKRFVTIAISDNGESLYNEQVETNTEYDANPLFSTTQRIAVYGRHWDITIHSTRAFRSLADDYQPWAILFGGLTIDALLLLLFFLLSQSNSRATRLAQAMTAQFKASEERFGRVIQATNDGIWDWPDITLDKQYWSAHWKSLLGYAEAEIEAKASRFFELVHPHDIARTRQVLEDAIKTNSPFALEHRLNTKHQGYRWFESRGMLSRDPQTGKQRMTGSLADIHPRIEQQQREALLKSLAIAASNTESFDGLLTEVLSQLGAHLNCALAHAYRWDEHQQCLVSLRQWYLPEESKVSSAEFVQTTQTMLLAAGLGIAGKVYQQQSAVWAEDFTADNTAMQPRAGVAAAGLLSGFAFPVLCGSDVAMVLEFFFHTATREDAAVLNFMQPVAALLGRALEREEAVQEIRKAHAFQKLMLDNIMYNNPNVIFVKDSQLRIVAANRACLELFPESLRDSVIGQSTIEHYATEEAERFVAEDCKALQQGFSETIETMQCPDGVTRSFHTQKIRFRNTHGHVFILGISVDVSEREAMIDALADSNEQLERFAYICSHDLQEPLRMIRSFSGKLEDYLTKQLQLDDKAQRYLRFVMDGAARGQMLIADILSYSSLQRDTQSLQKIDVNETMMQLAQSCMAVEEGRAPSITYDPLPVIMGNTTQIYQLFQNLVNNGLKYQRPDTPPCIHVSAVDAGQYWRFSVTDNGIGMEERHLKKIFDIFQRLHRRDEYQGTGVGLAICKKIVERHGGEIWAESRVGEGSTFYFTIVKHPQQGDDV